MQSTTKQPSLVVVPLSPPTPKHKKILRTWVHLRNFDEPVYVTGTTKSRAWVVHAKRMYRVKMEDVLVPDETQGAPPPGATRLAGIEMTDGKWRSAPELSDLFEVIGTRDEVLACIRLQAAWRRRLELHRMRGAINARRTLKRIAATDKKRAHAAGGGAKEVAAEGAPASSETGGEAGGTPDSPEAAAQDAPGSAEVGDVAEGTPASPEGGDTAEGAAASPEGGDVAEGTAASPEGGDVAEGTAASPEGGDVAAAEDAHADLPSSHDGPADRSAPERDD